MKRPLPTDLYNQRVSVYRNLNANCLSVVQKQHVAGHAVSVILKDVRFRVQEGGRQRVIKDRRKNVHAFVDGTLTKCSEKDLGIKLEKAIEIGYNPYRAGYFFERQTGEAVYKAKLCVITPAGVLAIL